MSKKAIYKIVIICIVLLGISFLLLWQLLPEPLIHYKATEIHMAIAQSITVMTYLYALNTNFDDFNCENDEMVSICKEIDRNYEEEDGKEPTIVHDTSVDSQRTCIYSLVPCDSSSCRKEVLEQGFWYRLRHKRENYWFCADNTGRMGYTKLNPGSTGHCVEGESASCPEFIRDFSLNK